VIQVDAENPGSAAVARRAGFNYVKRAREAEGNRLDWYARDLTISTVPGR
jgi:RimJ/RimL family protein N-acetyltransferase